MSINTLKIGSLKIKNVSGAAYTIDELGGHVLADQEEVDLMDSTLLQFYIDYQTARRLCYDLTSAKLCQDIIGGVIAITADRPPLR